MASSGATSTDTERAAADPAGGGAAPAREREKASWAFAAGEVIVLGRRAVRSLGGGPICEAYLAWDEARCALVVCKLLRPDQAGDDGARRKLRREARILAQLAHPSIVRSFDAALDGARPHIVLEHVDAANLRRRIRRRGALPLEQAVRLGVHLAAALHYLRLQGLVHLDVKPSNVVLGVPPRLIDLSLGRSLERARQIQRPVGTTAYMAPEACTPGKRGEIGSPADVWGLGLTLYEALAARKAFPEPAAGASENAAARYSQLVSEPLSLPNEVPAVLARIVMRCLAADPALRPTALELLGMLEPLAQELATR